MFIVFILLSKKATSEDVSHSPLFFGIGLLVYRDTVKGRDCIYIRSNHTIYEYYQGVHKFNRKCKEKSTKVQLQHYSVTVTGKKSKVHNEVGWEIGTMHQLMGGPFKSLMTEEEAFQFLYRLPDRKIVFQGIYDSSPILMCFTKNGNAEKAQQVKQRLRKEKQETMFWVFSLKCELHFPFHRSCTTCVFQHFVVLIGQLWEKCSHLWGTV